MKCIKCGGYVYNSDKFCRICGSAMDSSNCQYGNNIANSKFDSSSCHQKQYDYSYQYSKIKPSDNKNTHADQYEYSNKFSIDHSKYNYINTVTDSGDDKYVKAYIGKNYESIKKSKFSILTFLLGPWYLLYRKIWKPAIALIIINIAAQVLLPENISNIASCIANGIVAFNFQNIYLKQVESKVESIKQQNLDKTTRELLEICTKKGTPSIKMPLIAIIVMIILLTILLIALVSRELDTPNEYLENQSTQKTSIKYIKPDDLILLENSEYYSRFEYNTNTTTCNITINKFDLGNIYESSEEYLEAYPIPHNSTEKTTPIMPIGINNQVWNHTTLISPTKTEYHYAYRSDNIIYVIKTYNIKKSTTDDLTCRKKYNEFINTITIETY